MISKKEHMLWNNKWLWIPLLLGVGLFFSYLQPLQMSEGGEATFLSMLVICLAGYFYGGWTGLLTAFLFGGIKFLLRDRSDSNHVAAELYDYILGYGLLGFGGFLYRKRGGLQTGYLLAALLRYIESTWNCAYFYQETVRYSIVYSSYIGMEVLITFLILCIPQVLEAIEYLKYVATHAYEDNLDTF